MNRSTVAAACATTLLLATAGAAPAVAQRAAPGPGVQLSGAAAQQGVTHCGAARAVTVAPAGRAVAAVANPARTARGRAARRGSRIVVHRRANGRWVRASSAALGAGTAPMSRAVDTSRAATGDYRVRIQRRGGQAGRASFLRVGVGEIVDVPVSFRVRNQNRTSLACEAAPDGAEYTVRGSMVAPRAALQAERPAATLYYHDLSSGAFAFRFDAVPGYDLGLEQARDGRASVVVERLGYPASLGPDGGDVCYASQADIADQLVRDLRDRDYETAEGRGPGFARVALAGQGAGAFIAEIAQYSFASADALVVAGYADQGASPLAGQALTAASLRCRTSPERSGGATGVPNYAFFGATEQDFVAASFHDAEPAVVAEALRLRTRDPCGDLASIPPSTFANQPLVRTITSPVLVILGEQDALFPPPAGELQRGNYPNSRDVTLAQVPGVGHALTLERGRDRFRAALDRWLRDRGF